MINYKIDLSVYEITYHNLGSICKFVDYKMIKRVVIEIVQTIKCKFLNYCSLI